MIRKVSVTLAAVFMTFVAVWISVDAQHRADTITLRKGSYIIQFNSGIGIPCRVTWKVVPEDLGKVKREPNFKFATDKDTPKPRVKSSLYTRSGYHRGHMCPAADRSATKDLMKSTFVMSNVCPMTPHLNTGSWKAVEDLERAKAQMHGSCSIVAAPLFYPDDTTWIGRGRVAVPHAFMKWLIVPGSNVKPELYIFENK